MRVLDPHGIPARATSKAHGFGLALGRPSPPRATSKDARGGPSPGGQGAEATGQPQTGGDKALVNVGRNAYHSRG